MRKNIGNFVASALLLVGVVTSADAAIYRYSFSTTGSSGVFAFLDFDTTSSNFRLFDNTSNAFLASQIGVNGISFDFVGAQTLTAPAATFQTVWDTTTIGSLSATTDPIAPVGYTSAFATANNNDGSEIKNGGSTSFNFGNIAFSNIDNIALRLNTSNGALNSSGEWVVATSVAQVPEAETGAMMVLGLGILGFAARRRKQG